MIYNEILCGKYVSLRAVNINDCAFTAKLRADDEMCKYVHKVDTSLEGQEKFILFQQSRENDYYFLISSIQGNPLGTIALYNFDNGCAELGRWLSYGNAFENLESVILLYDFAFNELNMKKVVTRTNVVNDRVVNFWKNFGCDESYVEERQDYTSHTGLIRKDTYYALYRIRATKLLRY